MIDHLAAVKYPAGQTLDLGIHANAHWIKLSALNTLAEHTPASPVSFTSSVCRINVLGYLVYFIKSTTVLLHSKQCPRFVAVAKDAVWATNFHSYWWQWSVFGLNPVSIYKYPSTGGRGGVVQAIFVLHVFNFVPSLVSSLVWMRSSHFSHELLLEVMTLCVSAYVVCECVWEEGGGGGL